MKFGGQPTPWSDEQIDGLRCRTVAQMLIEEIGADGPESAEDAAKRAVAVIQRQRARIATLEAEPLYAHPLALREPTDDECREIADRFLCEVANAARGVRTGRAMFNAVREVMTK